MLRQIVRSEKRNDSQIVHWVSVETSQCGWLALSLGAKGKPKVLMHLRKPDRAEPVSQPPSPKSNNIEQHDHQIPAVDLREPRDEATDVRNLAPHRSSSVSQALLGNWEVCRANRFLDPRTLSLHID
jgi:hypothetical protein